MLTPCLRLEREGQIKPALRCYQEALADDPESDSAKTKVELLKAVLQKQVCFFICLPFLQYFVSNRNTLNFLVCGVVNLSFYPLSLLLSTLVITCLLYGTLLPLLGDGMNYFLSCDADFHQN